MSTLNSYHIQQLQSGWNRRGKEIMRVSEVASGMSTVTAGEKEWLAKGKLQASSLVKGQKVLASYNSSNQGADVYEILGFTDNDRKYGEGGVKFDSVKQVLKAKNVKGLKELEELPGAHDEYGEDVYLVVKDIETGESGPWFYLYDGRWARGSGAEKLSFVEVEEFDAKACQAKLDAEAKAQERRMLENKRMRLQERIAEMQAELAEVEAQLA